MHPIRSCKGGYRHSPPFALVLALSASASAMAAVGCGGASKSVSGLLFDCETKEPIAQARLTVEQRGWGWGASGPIWDKSYVTEVQSGTDGSFHISYRVGSAAHLIARKPGYCIGHLYAAAGGSVAFGLERGPDPDRVATTCPYWESEDSCNPARRRRTSP